MAKTMQFLVTVSVVNAVDRSDMANHIQEATERWGGQYTPDDLLFPTNIESVTVQYINSISKKKE